MNVSKDCFGFKVGKLPMRTQYPTQGTLSNTPWSALPPTYTISVASLALQHLASFVFGRLWLHWSQDLCFGRSVHVRDNYPSGQLTHQIAHIWGHIQPG